MARSTSAGPSNSTLVEEEIRVKKEKVNKGKRTRIVEDEEEDGVDGGRRPSPTSDGEEAGEAEPGDDEGSSPRGVKRVRVNEDGDSRPGDIASQVKERVKTLPRDTDGYIPGSIVRIQLKNFVTYDYVEFRPGPYLNMILGPNGTGKSSIACAICLGLNFPPSTLGRASELNSFVKHGYDSGYIEIELKGPKGRGNLIIRRNITATSKGSQFLLNGQKISAKDVTVKMADLNVQVGNLCSFLPQDKVSEFAQMTPQQLLKETQRAAGDSRLTTWHTTLINAGHELKAINECIRTETETLETLRTRNEAIERDVQRYRERKKIEAMIKLLTILIPVERYRVLRKKCLEAKARQRNLHDKVKKLKDKNEPAHALLQQLDGDCKEHEKARDKIKKMTQARFLDLKKKWTDSEKLEQDAEKHTLDFDNLKKEEKDRAKRIKILETEVVRTKEEIQKRSEVEGEREEDLLDEMRQLNMERQDVILRKESVDEKLKANIDGRARVNARLNLAYGELTKLDDVDVRKLQALSKWDKDSAEVVTWLRKNKELFKMEVFEPPVLCLNVPNRQFAQAVEGCFTGSQIKTFVAQCQDDLDTFNHYVNDTEKALGRRVRVPTWFRSGSGEPLLPSPMSRDEMHALGFDGYAIEYVECPQGLYWYLQRELNFHRTAIALNSANVNVDHAMQAVANPATGGGATFICGTTMNIVSRSRYGHRAMGNLTREIGPVRSLGNASIDPEVKKRIDTQITECQQQISNYDQERKELDLEEKRVADEDKVFEDRAIAIKKRKDAVKTAKETKAKMEAKLRRNENDLARLRNHPPPDREGARLKKEILRVSKQRVKIAKEYTDMARLINVEHAEATRMGIQYLQAAANKKALQELCDRKDAKYQSALVDYNKVDEEFRIVKTQSKELLEEVKVTINEAEPEIREEYESIQAARIAYDKALVVAEEDGTTPPSPEGVDTRTFDELQSELEKQQADLELNLQTNPGVEEQYERRKREIEATEKKIEEQQKTAGKKEKTIQHARENWQPALEKLVTSIGRKFSAAFDRFGCAGEIRISEHEDYDKWAIDILVKFRDTEKLQLLTGQRQSGGERSLTTILYLLSLSEEARAPFSLVDEINQGMDQRAERTVHNSMVEVTCNAESAQYFLITPKLLPDLKYHERMKILCVNNGEWLPEEPGLGNMMAMIDAYVQRKQ